MPTSRGEELYLPLFTDFIDNAKTADLAMRLNLPIPWVAGHLIALWVWALKHRPSGIFDRSEAGLIRVKMQYRSGTDGLPMADRWATDAELLQHLIDSKWIDVLKGGKSGTRVSLHDWDSYVGTLRQVARARMHALAKDNGADSQPIDDRWATDPSKTALEKGESENKRNPKDEREGNSPVSETPNSPSPVPSALLESEAKADQEVFEAAKSAGCPNHDPTIRKYAKALSMRRDVGREKLLKYLRSDDGMGKAVIEWENFFKPRKALANARSSIDPNSQAARHQSDSKTCGRCHGGKVESKVSTDVATGKSKLVDRPCEVCGGRGKVPA